MPVTSMKNTMLSPVSADLGLGSTIPMQVQDGLEEEKKRKALLGMGTGSNVARDLGLSPLTMGSQY